MWEYALLCHRVAWKDFDAPVPSHDGWDEWEIQAEAPGTLDGELTTIEALNVLGRNGWEVVHVEEVQEMPPGVYNARYAIHSKQYLLKRERPAG